MKNNYIAIIPARAGSKGIPKKNMILLDGKPLIYYTLASASKSNLLTEIIVNSDDDEILNYGRLFHTGLFKRSIDNSSDTSSTIDVVLEMYYNKVLKPEDVIVLLQPTSPLRTSQDIDNAITLFENSLLVNKSLVSVVNLPHIYNPEQVYKYNSVNIYDMSVERNKYNRQSKVKYIARNGAAIYIVTLKDIIKNNSFFTENTIAYHMPKVRSFDLDDIDDLFIIESIIKHSLSS